MSADEPKTLDEIDADQLLKNCHQSLALNNGALLGVSFATLDKFLAAGGRLPQRWSTWDRDGVRYTRGAVTTQTYTETSWQPQGAANEGTT